MKNFLAGGAVASLLASSVALQAQSSPKTTTPIQHVVVIFQENVSFDHYFGTYPNAANNNSSEPSFTAAPGTPTVNGLSGALLASNPNSAPPVRLTRAQPVTCDQDHNYNDEQKAFNSGLMNKFVESTGVGSGQSCDVGGLGNKVVMAYYDGNTVTALWNYAQNFAMSDNSFGTTFGPSTPGVLNLIAGNTCCATVTAGAAAGNLAGGATNGPVIGDPRPDPSLDDCTLAPPRTYISMAGNKNVGDLLNAKNITWGWFQGGFKPSSRKPDGTAVCATSHNNVSGASAGTDYIPHHAGFMYFPQTANPHHLPPTSTAAIGATDQANHNYDLSDFFAALSAGNLPAVSFLKAGAYQDGHAGYSDPLDEQTFLVNTINALEQSPFWNTMAIFIAYDDSDGWYDHVIGPIVSESNVSDDFLTGTGSCGAGAGTPTQGRCGFGPRLPLMLISPFAKVNYVDHSVSDQSSILRFIEDNWSLGRIGNNSTDATAGSLLGMFNFNGGVAKALILDPSTGQVISGGSTSGSPSTGMTTQAVASPKNAVVVTRQFQLDGSASTSFDGKPLTYLWTIPAGSLQAAISGATSATPTVQFGLGRGNYTFQLTVTDSIGQTSTDTVTVDYTD
ncbi:MAG TPA: alkaline phosphatase family protein [Bryobacteraceae bacterium]|nr:alkaline phosphatase family protein [Bryobacteraceae bacterium]